MQVKRVLSLFVLCVSVGGALSWSSNQPQLRSQAQLVPSAGENLTKAADVPYVPTPYEVVMEMLNMADVTKEDVIYDLGSGDGRLVITAAQKFGARGVGVEINPRLIKKSQENAQEARVAEQVQFIQQDLFEMDISSASVVTLYLLPKVNLRLRPKLLKELKPGTRIVSHQFDMKDWKPDSVVTLDHHSRLHTLFYWVIPAEVTGTWQWKMPTSAGEQPYQLVLQQKFQEVKGMLKTNEGSIPIKKPKLVGKQLSFNVTQNVQGQKVTIQFNGQVEGNSIKGIMEMSDQQAANPRTWEATRQ